jgi:nucleoside-diphosphate-sugar epimerase
LMLYTSAGLDALKNHPDFSKFKHRFELVEGDIRNPNAVKLATTGIDTIIHLAAISNDPTGDIDEVLTRQVNFDAIGLLLANARSNGVQRFINASSSSVFGIKDDADVTELLEPEPITFYSKYKMLSEWLVVAAAAPDFCAVNVRPATVCGFSPRMRLDVSVNILTMQAIKNGKITVFGGNQVRPNIHIDDITDLYLFLLDHPEHTGIYNAGFENISILDIARMVTKHVPAEIVVSPSNDPRSYRVNSDKLLATGFKPKKTVEDAIKEMIGLYGQGVLREEDRWHNLKWMQKEVL